MNRQTCSARGMGQGLQQHEEGSRPGALGRRGGWAQVRAGFGLGRVAVPACEYARQGRGRVQVQIAFTARGQGQVLAVLPRATWDAGRCAGMATHASSGQHVRRGPSPPPLSLSLSIALSLHHTRCPLQPQQHTWDNRSARDIACATTRRITTKGASSTAHTSSVHVACVAWPRTLTIPSPSLYIKQYASIASAELDSSVTRKSRYTLMETYSRLQHSRSPPPRAPPFRAHAGSSCTP